MELITAVKFYDTDPWGNPFQPSIDICNWNYQLPLN